jgi:hypothetical protein
MGKAKKFGIAVGIIIAVFFIIVIAYAASRSVTEETKPTEQLITKPAVELLPSKDVVPTQWKIPEHSTIEGSYTGFIDGVRQSYVKGGGLTSETTTVEIYRFNSFENATAFYTNLIKEIEEKRGYESRFIAGNCFGAYYQGNFADMMKIPCVKDNVVFTITSGGSFLETDENARMFTKLVGNAIK